jgi:hypothetical protein
MRDGETWDAIPEELLTDCAQLTKANSIEGNKKDNITIIYTPWSNLKKDGSMATGQVGFKDNKKVKRVYVSARENAIVNRLNKTKVEKHPDLRQEKEDRERELRKVERIAQQERVSWTMQKRLHSECAMLTSTLSHRSEKTPDWQRSVSSSSGRKSTCTTTSTLKIRWSATRTERRDICLISCKAMIIKTSFY